MITVTLFALALAVFLVVRRKPGADLGLRVEQLERRVTDLQAVVDALRPARVGAPAPPRPAQPPSPPPRAPQPSPPPRPRRGPPAARTLTWEPPKVSAADLLGAKALAFTGGVVTLLGVVFFFVLAVNRGWIGPELRVGAGALASSVVFGAGLWLKRRYETTYSALAAVGVGIAGAYITLLAAVSLYDLISRPVALVVAGAIACVGVAVSLLWSAQVVAGFGLIGAMAVPATLVFQGGLRQMGTAFVAVVFAAGAVVAVRQRWWKLLQAAAVVSVPQALAQVAEADATRAGIVGLAAAFWLLYLAAAVAFQVRVGKALAASPSSLLTGSAAFGGICAALLWAGVRQGIVMLVAAATYVVLSGAFFRRRRDLAALLGVLGLALGAVGLAQELSSSSLTYVWAAETAVLAWLGGRLRDSRLQLPAVSYLVAAVVHALIVEASPDHLFETFRHPAAGAPGLVLIAGAAFVVARTRRSWDEGPSRGIWRALDPLLAQLRVHAHAIDVAGYLVSALTAAYAVSLGVLELARAVSIGFDWGHVAVTSIWAAACLLAVAAPSRKVVALGLLGLGATVTKVLAFDVLFLAESPRGTSLVVVGAAALIAGVVAERVLTGAGITALLASLALVLSGALTLWPSDYALLAVGGTYVALSAAVRTFAGRDVSTLLWTLGFATTGVAGMLLLHGVWLVLGYSASAAALAAISVVTREQRLLVASLAYVLVGAAYALVTQAPPADLLLARSHPADGVPSLLLVIAATTALGMAAKRWVAALWVSGTLAVYACSLAILEAAQRVSPAGIHTDFQRGQTAVSAFWGVLALASLYVGLKRRHNLLRAGGFLLFAISLGKLFAFDLPSLSSAQRALSFLAVGAGLLLGGFFYQRLSGQNGGGRIA